MKIYHSKTHYYRIVKAEYMNRASFLVECKKKDIGSFGDFLFEKFNCYNPMSWKVHVSKNSFDEALDSAMYQITLDEISYNESHPKRTIL